MVVRACYLSSQEAEEDPKVKANLGYVATPSQISKFPKRKEKKNMTDTKKTTKETELWVINMINF